MYDMSPSAILNHIYSTGPQTLGYSITPSGIFIMLGVVVALYYGQHFWTSISHLPLPPGPPRIPILGNALQMSVTSFCLMELIYIYSIGLALRNGSCFRNGQTHMVTNILRLPCRKD
jgi:hypothetical protein